MKIEYWRVSERRLTYEKRLYAWYFFEIKDLVLHIVNFWIKKRWSQIIVQLIKNKKFSFWDIIHGKWSELNRLEDDIVAD